MDGTLLTLYEQQVGNDDVGAVRVKGVSTTMGFQGAIFDVDGVLVNTPHYQAWRDALRELMDTEWAEIRGQSSYSSDGLSEDVYQEVAAGRPRLAGAQALLEHYGVPDAEARAQRYGEVKQQHMTRLITSGQFQAFDDALRLVLDTKALGVPIAAASSSKNADLIMQHIRLDNFAAAHHLDNPLIRPGLTLLDVLDVDVSGRDLPRGKPDPLIFLTAARELGVEPGGCFVVEDAESGVEAAKAGGMAALGVARLHDKKELISAHADVVVTTLDAVSRQALAEGHLELKDGGAGRQ
jgi:beta-phosphoglucomutase-like phosphatase (HAD superfamily)